MPADPSAHEATLNLLERVPKLWTPRDSSTFSQADDKALFRLVAANFVERRIGLECRFAGRQEAYRLRITASGEGGFAKALVSFLEDSYALWREAWETLRKERPEAMPFRATACPPDEWRLTTYGSIAVDDLQPRTYSKAERLRLRRNVLDFVFQTGRHRARGPIAGEGTLEALERIDEPALGGQCTGHSEVLNLLKAQGTQLTEYKDELLAALAGGFSALNARMQSIAPRVAPAEVGDEPITLTPSAHAVGMTLLRLGSRSTTTIDGIIRSMTTGASFGETAVGAGIQELVRHALADRPHGKRRGCRLTTRGILFFSAESKRLAQESA
jgi:hypothetical protein